MSIRIALRRSREDSARPTVEFVHHDAIASAHQALGPRQPEHLSFPITSRADYESHRERAACRGKERIRAAEAYITTAVADAVT